MVVGGGRGSSCIKSVFGQMGVLDMPTVQTCAAELHIWSSKHDIAVLPAGWFAGSPLSGLCVRHFCRYGGMHVIPAGEYYAADLLPPSSTGVKQQQQGQQMQQQEQQRLQRALRGTGSIITH